jgi:hypothetical protein
VLLIWQLIQVAWDTIYAIISGALRLIWTIIKAAWDLIVLLVSSALSVVWNDIKDKWNTIVSFIKGIPEKVRNGLSAVKEAFLAPFRAAFDAIKRAWNDTVGGFGISIPSVFGFGGASFTIPYMHTGGFFDAGFGSDEGPAVLQDGEAVLDRAGLADLASAADNLQPGGLVRVLIEAAGEREFKRWLRAMVKTDGGGDVQLALGGTR